MMMLELMPLAPDAEVETYALTVSEASLLLDRLSESLAALAT